MQPALCPRRCRRTRAPPLPPICPVLPSLSHTHRRAPLRLATRRCLPRCHRRSSSSRSRSITCGRRARARITTLLVRLPCPPPCPETHGRTCVRTRNRILIRPCPRRFGPLPRPCEACLLRGGPRGCLRLRNQLWSRSSNSGSNSNSSNSNSRRQHMLLRSRGRMTRRLAPPVAGPMLSSSPRRPGPRPPPPRSLLVSRRSCLPTAGCKRCLTTACSRCNTRSPSLSPSLRCSGLAQARLFPAATPVAPILPPSLYLHMRCSARRWTRVPSDGSNSSACSECRSAHVHVHTRVHARSIHASRQLSQCVASNQLPPRFS